MIESKAVQPFVTAALIDSLPDPHDLKRVVKARIEAATEEFRQQRGNVHLPEDTFDLHRRLQATKEQCEQYARGFKEAAKLIGQLQLEELETAVGEQDGVPMQGLTVPAADGDIRLTPEFENQHTIDRGQVCGAIIANVLGSAQVESFPQPIHEALHELLWAAVTAALHRLEQAGKWEPQISKVKALADNWSREGDDSSAAVLRTAIRSKRVYKESVKVERRDPNR